MTRSGVRFQVIGIVVVGILSALSWLSWLGWDNEYQVDPATGVSSGPYQAWQVVGCALSLLALLAAALVAGVRPWAAGAALTCAFTAAWTVQAAADETGMYGVGAVLLLLGLGVATALTCVAVTGLRGRWRGRAS